MTERIAILIDGQNTHAAMKADGMSLDYVELVARITGDRYLLRPYFFALDIEGQDDYRPLRPLLDFLEYHGFAVKAVHVRDYEDGRRERGSYSVPLACTALDLAFGEAVDHIILCTGDGQYLPLIETLQQRVRVTIASVLGRCADEMRRQADHFIDLEPLRAAVTRPVKTAKEAVTA